MILLLLAAELLLLAEAASGPPGQHEPDWDSLGPLYSPNFMMEDANLGPPDSPNSDDVDIDWDAFDNLVEDSEMLLDNEAESVPIPMQTPAPENAPRAPPLSHSDPESSAASTSGQADLYSAKLVPNTGRQVRKMLSPEENAAWLDRVDASDNQWHTIGFSRIRSLRRMTQTEEKLAVIASIEAAMQPLTDPIPQIYRAPIARIIRPVMRCFRKHCGSDINVFIQRWGANFPHTKFSTKRCPGPSWLRQPVELTLKFEPAPEDDDKPVPVSVKERICGFELGTGQLESILLEIALPDDLDDYPIDRQLLLVKAIYEQYGALRKDQLHPRSYQVMLSVQAVLGCLIAHCNNDVGIFCARWPDFRLPRFQCRHCPGLKAERCGEFLAPSPRERKML